MLEAVNFAHQPNIPTVLIGYLKLYLELRDSVMGISNVVATIYLELSEYFY